LDDLDHWILVVGGVGYVLSTFVTFLAPGASGLAGALPLAATVGGGMDGRLPADQGDARTAPGAGTT